MNVSPLDLRALGWTLLHFLWQGTAAAAFLCSINLLLRRGSSHLRYALASATLLLMLVLPVATFWFVREAAPARPTEPAVSSAGPGREGSSARVEPGPGSFELRRRVEPFLPGLVGLWGAGVLVLSLRALGGWALVQRLRRAGLQAVPPPVEATLTRLVDALRIKTAVRLYESALVGVPTVIGWVRPLVLLPASALTGLSPQQLELILAHELAHVRRYDYLVNLLQTAVETLLFYHPAVWWVSHRMRVEREHCCDDLAVLACGNPGRYARALADLEGLCSDAPALAMAASGGSLFERVARLVGPPPHRSRGSRGLSAALAGVALLVALCAGSSLVGRSATASTLARLVPADTVDEVAPGAAQETATPLPAPAKASKAAQPRSSAPPRTEPRAFPLQRVLELAEAGVTPEYIDEMDALGYSSLTSDQLIALRTQGVGPQYVRDLATEGYRGLSCDQLVALRAQGVSADFAHSLKELGLRDLSLSDLTELRTQGVSADFVAELRKAGYDELSPSKLVALRSQGVSGQYASELTSLGYGKLSTSKLIALRSQGVTPEYVRELAALGYPHLEIQMVLALRSQGVTPDYVRALKAAGYEGLSAGVLIELRAHGVTPEFVKELSEAGFPKPSPEELIELRDRGVGADLLKKLKGRQ
jgi:beta-lactamase regulating signal transducer with metallopeptidase domain